MKESLLYGRVLRYLPLFLPSIMESNWSSPSNVKWWESVWVGWGPVNISWGSSGATSPVQVFAHSPIECLVPCLVEVDRRLKYIAVAVTVVDNSQAGIECLVACLSRQPLQLTPVAAVQTCSKCLFRWPQWWHQAPQWHQCDGTRHGAGLPLVASAHLAPTFPSLVVPPNHFKLYNLLFFTLDSKPEAITSPRAS